MGQLSGIGVVGVGVLWSVRGKLELGVMPSPAVRLDSYSWTMKVKDEFDYWLLAYFTPQQHVSVSQGQICSDKCTCCHTEIIIIIKKIISIFIERLSM